MNVVSTISISNLFRVCGDVTHEPDSYPIGSRRHRLTIHFVMDQFELAG